MGLFDGAFNPNLGWLGQGMSPVVNQPDDPMNPTNNWGAPSRGHDSLMQILGQLLPPTSGGQQTSPWAQPQTQQPMDPNAGIPISAPGLPSMGAPQNVGPGVIGNGGLAGSYGGQTGGPSLDQRAYGMSGPPGQMVPPSVIGGAPQSPQMPPQAAQSMAQAPQDAGPGIGDRLSAGFQGFAHGGGLLPALGNLVGGLSTGQRQDTAGQPKLQKTGTDPLTGQDTFAWVNPQTQTMMPATMGQSGSPQGGPSLGAFSQAVQSGVTGDALYQHLPPQVANTVKSMIDGRAPVPAGAALRSPQGMALMNAANAIDPKFDQTQWAARNALRKNYEGGGKNYQELQAIGTVAGHLKDFAEAADKLDNTSFPLINQGINAYRSATGDARVDRFNTVKQAVSNELSKAYRGGNVTEGDVREWQQNVNAAKSPEQLRGVIGKMNELLGSKRQALEEGYRGVMGPNAPMPENFTATNDRTKKTFDDIAKWSNGEKGGGTGGLTAGTYNWTPQGVSR